MLRSIVCLAVVLLAAEAPSTVFAQSTAPAATSAKPSRIRLTVERLKEMRAKWVQNRPKMKACRAEVKTKGLIGDDRWFYMEDCMGKT